MEPVLPQPSVLDLAMILARHKWSAMVVLVVTLVSSLVWIFVIRDDLYEVSARVLVKMGREVAAPSTIIGGTQAVLANRAPDVNSEVELLQSGDLAAAVVDQLHLDVPLPPKPVPAEIFPKIKYYAKSYIKSFKQWSEDLLVMAGVREKLSPREKTIDAVKKAVVIRPPKDSYVIVVSMYLPAREGASRVLNALLDLYQQRRAALFEEGTAVPVFRSEAAARSAGLSEAETQLQAFETQNGISAIEKQKEVLLGEIARAEEEFRSADLARGDAAEKLSRMERELKSSEPDFATLGDFDKDSFVGNLLLQLSQLQKEREQLRLTELDSGARIQNNRSQFSALMKLVLSNLRSTLDQSEATLASRASAVKQLQTSLADLHGQESRWADLRRRTEVLESDYLFYGKKLAEASANAALAKADISNVVIAERAMDPIAPAGIRKTTLLEISLGVALLVALSWVAILEFFDHGVYSGANLEKFLGAPVFAVVPFAKPAKELDTSRSRWYQRGHVVEN